jgi:hypothetical protein
LALFWLPLLQYLRKMKFKFLLPTVFAILMASVCLAGPPPPPSGGGGSGGNFACWPPPCIPIDGGISLLIAAGAIYGGRKLYKNQQEKNIL